MIEPAVCSCTWLSGWNLRSQRLGLFAVGRQSAQFWKASSFIIFSPRLVIGLRLNLAHILQVLLELELWLIDSLRERVGLLLQVVEVVRALWLPSCGTRWQLRWLALAAIIFDRSRPPCMLLELLPPDSIYRIFLEYLEHEVVVFRREVLDHGDLLHPDLLDEVLESARVEGRLACRQLDEDAAEGPEVGLVAVDAAVLEQFWRHVVRRTGLVFRALTCLRMRRGALLRRVLHSNTRKVRHLLRQSKVAELQLAILIHKHI